MKNAIWQSCLICGGAGLLFLAASSWATPDGERQVLSDIEKRMVACSDKCKYNDKECIRDCVNKAGESLARKRR